MIISTAAPDQERPLWESRRPWSLWDIMINYQVFGLCRFLSLLWLEEGIAASAKFTEINDIVANSLKLPTNPAFPEPDTLGRLQGLTTFAKTLCDQLDLEATRNRVRRFEGRMRVGIDREGVCAELRALREAIDDDVNYRYFYRYPKEKAAILLKFSHDWEKVNKAFRTVEREARAAVDCYALGHNTASVFHAMRAAEHGLRALAKERRIVLKKNKPIEWANWQEIITALEDEVKIIGKTKKAGNPKDRALEFYSGAMANLNGFKDEYRNLVMHVRADYDDLQALRAIQRVHAFLERLSEKIDERHYRIRWGLK